MISFFKRANIKRQLERRKVSQENGWKPTNCKFEFYKKTSFKLLKFLLKFKSNQIQNKSQNHDPIQRKIVVELNLLSFLGKPFSMSSDFCWHHARYTRKCLFCNKNLLSPPSIPQTWVKLENFYDLTNKSLLRMLEF